MYLVSHPVVFIFTSQQPCGRKIHKVSSTLIRIIKNSKKIQNKEGENKLKKKKQKKNRILVGRAAVKHRTDIHLPAGLVECYVEFA